MNIHHTSYDATEMSGAIDGAARALAARQEAKQELTPPSYGEDQRKFIDTCVENIVGDLCRRMEGMHSRLKTIEQQVLASAEKVRHTMREHAAITIRLDDEIKAMDTIISDIAEQTRAAQS
jgi:hypothetical protein